MSDENSPEENRLKRTRSRSIKLILILLLLTAPVLIVMVVFSQLAGKESPAPAPVADNAYKLTEGYERQDIVRIIARMREDSQFQFYFYALSDEDLSDVVNNVIETLMTYRDSVELYRKIEEQTQKVLELSQLFRHVDYPEEFLERPGDYPDLNVLLWDFLKQEFLMTILGQCYKSTYEPGFAFHWDLPTRRSALKLKNIIVALKRVEAAS